MLRQLFGGPLLTFAVLAAALGVSYARRRDEKRRRQQAGGAAARGAVDAAADRKAGAGHGKYFAVLSAEALKLLVRGPLRVFSGNLHVCTCAAAQQRDGFHA
jgi:hypothetical protein